MITLREDQSDLIQRCRSRFLDGCRSVLMVAATGFGKCLGKGTPVLLYDGRTVPVEDVAVGDMLMGPDSRPRAVLSTNSGNEMMYRVTPAKGDSYVVNESHILSLRMTPGTGRGYGDDELVNISVADYLKKNKTFKHCAKGWRAGVEFPEAVAPLIDPYILGLWLGDGSSKGLYFTVGDDEVEAAVRSFASANGLFVRTEPNSENSINLYIVERPGSKAWCGRKGGKPNGWLRKLGVLNNKHIPVEYKTGSRETRLQLLAGLMDSDGHQIKGGFDFVQKNERLFDDVLFVARSLGFAGYKSKCRKACANNGVVGDYFRTSIFGATHEVPCRVERKKCPVRRQKKNVLRVGLSVEPIGIGEFFGFTLDRDGLFMLGDFTVTHNTVTFSWLAQSAVSKGKRVLILVHRDALLDQVSATLDKFGVPHSFIAPDRKFDPKCLVQVASVFCLARRIGKIDWAPDLIIVDEAHHAIPGSTWNKVLGAYPEARILGATATPERLGGQGLIDTFECMELGPEVRWLIDQGALSDFVLYRADTETVDVPVRGGDYAKAELSKAKNTRKITGDVISHYKQLADGKKTIGFCVDIAHAAAVAAQFRDAGYRAASIDGDMQKWAQRKMLDDFGAGVMQVMTSCDLVSEGFDLPAIECGIFLRDTKSIALARQQMGRVIRFLPDVKYKVLLDHAGITRTHGWPDDEVKWSLEGKEKRPAQKKQFETRKCPGCFADLRPSAVKCKYCGHEFQVEARIVKQVDGRLVEATREPVDKEALAAEVAAAKSVQELTRIGKARGYKNPGWWAIQVANGRTRRNA